MNIESPGIPCKFSGLEPAMPRDTLGFHSLRHPPPMATLRLATFAAWTALAAAAALFDVAFAAPAAAPQPAQSAPAVGEPVTDAAAGSSSPAAAQPAEWRSFDLLVQLEDLPHSYSCDDLWYKFRDLLLKLGARAYMTITPYRCATAGGPPATSPRVELKFQLPRTLSGVNARYAQVSVVDETIRLSPGSPASLQDKDCELVHQLQGTLFSALPVHVTAANFSCGAPMRTFALNVEAPVAAGRQAAAPLESNPPRR